MAVQWIRSREALKAINERTGPVVTLAFLMGAGMLAHCIAMAHVSLLGDLSATLQPTVAGRLHLVEYVNSHPVIMLPYLVAFASGLFWINLRKLPRWSFWLTLVFLALPVLGYIWICFRISTHAFWPVLH